MWLFVIPGILFLTDVLTSTTAYPLFQLPTGCAQKWDLSTYDNHWPDSDSLDMAERSSSNANICEGQPVRASAAGYVNKSYIVKMSDPKHCWNGENRVIIRHDGGYFTHYFHLEYPVAAHLQGQRVAQGQIIGYTGKTGKCVSNPHIHYTQLKNGVAVRSKFDGKYVSTHQGDKSSWGKWAKESAESAISGNCAGEKFLSYRIGLYHYALIYKPSSGHVKIIRFANNGKSVTTKWEGKWSLQWTTMETYKINGINYAVLYKARTGKVTFIKLRSNGYTNVASGSWAQGWTDIVPFHQKNRVYLLIYNTVRGWANWERVNVGSKFTTNIKKTTWVKARTLLIPYQRNGENYLMLYSGGGGIVKIVKVSFLYSSVITKQTYSSSSWTKNWTHIVPVNSLYALAYSQETGRSRIWYMKSGGKGVTTKSTKTWMKSWTHITSIRPGSRRIMLYRTLTGLVKTVRVKADGSGSITDWATTWTVGYN